MRRKRFVRGFILSFTLIITVLLSACNSSTQSENTLHDNIEGFSGDLVSSSSSIDYSNAEFEINQTTMNNHMQYFESVSISNDEVFFNDDYFFYKFNQLNGETAKIKKSFLDSFNKNGVISNGVIFGTIGFLATTDDIDTKYNVARQQENDGVLSYFHVSDVLPYKDNLIYITSTPDDRDVVGITSFKDCQLDSDYSASEESSGTIILHNSEDLFEIKDEDAYIHKIGVYEDMLLISGSDGMYSFDLRSKNLTELVSKTDDEDVESLIVCGEYIYFQDNRDCKIYRMKFDGSEKEVFTTLDSTKGVINCDENYLYLIHTDEDTTEEGKLYKINLENPDDVTVLATGSVDGVLPYHIYGIYMSDEYIYWKSQGWWRVSKNGGNAELLRFPAIDENDTEWDTTQLKKETFAVGYHHVVTIQNDGTVIAVGENENGECNVSSWTDIISVYAGSGYTIGVKENGQILTAGAITRNIEQLRYSKEIRICRDRPVSIKVDNSIGELYAPDYIENWSDIKTVSVSAQHSVGLKEDGTIIAGGEGKDGQCNVYEWTDVSDIIAVNGYSIGLKNDGTVLTTLTDARFYTGGPFSIDWDNITAIAASDRYIVGLTEDQTINVMVCRGLKEFSSVSRLSASLLQDWNDIIEVKCNQNFIVGLTSTGKLIADGWDSSDFYEVINNINNVRVN